MNVDAWNALKEDQLKLAMALQSKIGPPDHPAEFNLAAKRLAPRWFSCFVFVHNIRPQYEWEREIGPEEQGSFERVVSP